MKTDNQKHPGDITIDAERVELGTVFGSASVVAGGILYLHGIVTENLVISAGGKAIVRGTVGGDVTNEGGDLKISGVIEGTLRENGGKTVITGSAIVNSRSPGSNKN